MTSTIKFWYKKDHARYKYGKALMTEMTRIYIRLRTILWTLPKIYA